MSDKKLLEEQTIRRFMKLAKIDGLADEFVENNSGVIKEGMAGKHKVQKDTEELEEGSYGGDMEEMGYGKEEMQEEELGDLEMGGEDEGGGDNEELFKKVVEAVAGAMGVDASIEGDEGGMGDEEDMDMMGMDDEEGEGSEEEEEEGGEEEGEEEEELDEGEEKCEKCGGTDCEGDCEEEKKEEMDEQIAEAVLTRVKARLIAEAKAAKMNAMKKGMKGNKIAAKKAAKKGAAHAAGAKMEEAAKTTKASPKGHGPSKKPFGASKVGNVAKGKGKTGNLTPAPKPKKHK